VQAVIRFFKELYLAGFAVLFRLSRSKDIGFKVGYPILVYTLIQWFTLLGIYVDTVKYLNKKNILSDAVILTSYFVLYFLNVYILFIRKYGVKFAQEFGNFKKSKRILLTTIFTVLSVAGLIFSICSIFFTRHVEAY
jgi:hypothetical protein